MELVRYYNCSCAEFVEKINNNYARFITAVISHFIQEALIRNQCEKEKQYYAVSCLGRLRSLLA